MYILSSFILAALSFLLGNKKMEKKKSSMHIHSDVFDIEQRTNSLLMQFSSSASDGTFIPQQAGPQSTKPSGGFHECRRYPKDFPSPHPTYSLHMPLSRKMSIS